MKAQLSLVTCLNLARGFKPYRFDLLTDNGITQTPDSITSNIKAPTTADLGGSLGAKAGDINSGPTNAFQSYSNYVSGAGTPQDPSKTYQDLLVQNGIPQLQHTSESLQGNVNNLESAINRVTPNVTANTGNSLVTEGQREGMVNNQEGQLNLQLDPLAYGLGQVNTSLARQEENIGNQVGAVGQNNQMLSNANAMGVTVAQDNAARTMSGFTQDEQNTLAGLLQKMQIQGTLDEAEWNTLSTLSTQKQAYQQALGKIQAQANVTWQPLTPGTSILNTGTGRSAPVL